MNNLVTFYEIGTFRLNNYDPKLYNGLTPIKENNPKDKNDLLGMVKIFYKVFLI